MQEWALVGVWGCVGESSVWSDPGREACVDRGAASFTPPFIHSPSHGSGCLGRLLWPWGAWLSLWSLLPGTDCLLRTWTPT